MNTIEYAAREFARDIANNYDHDADAHRYGHADTQCRCCIAEAFLASLPSMCSKEGPSDEEIDNKADATAKVFYANSPSFTDPLHRAWVEYAMSLGFTKGARWVRDHYRGGTEVGALLEAAQAMLERLVHRDPACLSGPRCVCGLAELYDKWHAAKGGDGGSPSLDGANG